MWDIEVQYAVEATGLPDARAIRRWLGAVLQGRRERAEVVVRITDREEITRLNREYRQRDKPTNVLSFPSQLPAELGLALLGDIVICAEVVVEEARAQGKSVQAHWAHMVVHGGLHLLGYDHMEEQEAQRMEGLERELLASLGFPDPYE